MKNIEWDFGTFQAKVKAINGVLHWSMTGKKGSYPIEAINGIQYESGLMLGYFVILASGGKNEKIQIPSGNESKNTVQDINNYIREYKNHLKQQSTPTLSKADELLKLKELKDAGILNEDEFGIQKTRVLDGEKSIASSHREVPSYTPSAGTYHQEKPKGSSTWLYWAIGIVAFAVLVNLLSEPKSVTPAVDKSAFVPKLEAFKYPKIAITAMNEVGIGMMHGFKGDKENGYFSVTDYYVLEDRRPEQGMANNLSLHLMSNYPNSVERASIMLHINYPAKRLSALQEFKKRTKKMLSALKVPEPKGFNEAMTNIKPKMFDSDNCTVEIALEKGRIQTWRVIIKSK